MYVLTRHDVIPDTKVELEAEDTTVLGLFDNNTDAERAAQLVRESLIANLLEEEGIDKNGDDEKEVIERIDAETRFDIKEMHPNPAVLLHEYGSTPLR